MNTSQENLFRIINDLNDICKKLNSLRKGMEIDKERRRADDYYQILLTFKGMTGIINLRRDDKEDRKCSLENIKQHSSTGRSG